MSDPATWCIASSRSDFEDLRSGWERLFAANPRHSPFLAWGWIDAWLRHLAGAHRLQIAYLRDDNDELRFVLPLLRPEGKRRFGFDALMLACGYGPECSDHLGCLCTPDIESRAAELSAQAINRNSSRRDVVTLGVLDEAGDYPAKLHSAISSAGRIARLRDDFICPTIELPGSWDDYLSNLSSNLRAQVRRSLRHVHGDDELQFRSVEMADAAAFTAELIRLNRSRIRAKGEVSSLEQAEFREFLSEAVPYMASKGIAWMDTIERHGETVAGALNFIHGGCVYYYMGGFDKKVSKIRPGTALFALAIERAINQGAREFNFLRGAEAYKYRWGAKDVLTHRTVVYPGGRLQGRVMRGAHALYWLARRAARRARKLKSRIG